MLSRRYEVRDRVVLVTGGARGIGAAAARQLALRGAAVVLVDRDAAELERRAAQLGGRAAAIEADVTEVDALEAAVDQAVERFGGVDVVVANAGVSGATSTVATVDPADFERVIEVNLLGVWRTVRAALPQVVERRGYVLVIASVAAAVPSPLLAAYAASKAGAEAFARSLRMELVHTGTRVGVGYFGFVDTDMVREALARPEAGHAHRAIPAPLRRSIPAEAAGAAILRGIERRAKRVYAPGWVAALLALRGMAGPLDALTARHPRVVRACRMAESAGQAEAPAVGPRSG